MLYPKQAIMVDKLDQAYQQDIKLTQNHYFLSGEMGVGKTYMGAQLALNHSDHGVLIVVPDLVTNKWAQVLSTIMDPTNITIVDTKFTKEQTLDFTAGHVTIIPNQYFNRLFDVKGFTKTIANNDAQKHPLKLPQLIAQYREANHTSANRQLNYLNYLRQKPFLIYDEIHQSKATQLQCLNSLFQPSHELLSQLRHIGSAKYDNTIYRACFLTGTIFNVDMQTLYQLIDVTNHDLMRHQHLDADYPNPSVSAFFANIWRYISVSVALSDIDQTDETQIQQTILPIKSIPLSPIEHAFYDLVVAQLAANRPTTSRTVKQQQRLFASNLLDYPERRPLYEIKAAKHRYSHLRYDQSVVLSIPLAQLKLTETKKFQRLLKYLKTDINKSTVIYATDYQLIQQMVLELTKLGYHATTLPKRIKASQYSNYLNEALANHQIVIVNPNDVTVGIDIHAQRLIWYQLLTDMASIIQAQRRVYRLSSTKDSEVIFLPYSLTYQDELVDQISHAAKNNAASYGVQDESELAKKTHVLLAQLHALQQ